MHRIQNINAALAKEALAERTHIYTNWPAVLAGNIDGAIQFDNAWYLVDRETGAIIAKDSQPAPTLNVTLLDALQFSLPLPGPVTEITGEHVMAFIKAFHSVRMEALLAPTEPSQPE